MPSLGLTLFLLNYAIAAIAIFTILRRRQDPYAMLAWTFCILALPFAGSFLYWLIGESRIRRKAARRRKRLADLISRYNRWAAQRVAEGDALAKAPLPEDLAAVERLGRNLTHVPAVSGNRLALFVEGGPTLDALEEAIRGANHHINLCYYIWRKDATGRRFRDLLADAARRGVQVRLLLDSVGCFRMGRRFMRPLLDAGAKVEFFLPLHPLRKRVTIHLRNHRKIAVIDGQVSFIGSQNIGDEYCGMHKGLSPWHDTQLRIDGPASLFVQQTFAEDWFVATKENLDREAFFPEPRRPGANVVQVLPTGPDQDAAGLQHVLFEAVSSAQRSIRLLTPYFAPDAALLLALAHASYSGVRVELVLPTVTDVPIMLWAARSFYGELLDAGIHVYEYDHGVLHSKLMTVDDRWCMIGSANMDVRSFRLNFEISALVYDGAFSSSASALVTSFVSRSRRVRHDDVRGRTLRQQLAEGSARLLGPML